MASISLDDDLQRQLRQIAAGENRSPASVLKDAVRQYAERASAKNDFLAEAHASWADYRQDGLHLTGDEMRDWLKRWGSGSGSEPPDCHDSSSRAALLPG